MIALQWGTFTSINNPQILKPKAMKTVHFIIPLLFVLFASISCQKENIGPSNDEANGNALKTTPVRPALIYDASIVNGRTKTRYEVVVHFSNEQALCKSYLVELKDETGRFIGPSQDFDPGISVYNFYESVTSTGTRIARLVPAPYKGRLACSSLLYTEPAIKTGKFIAGGSYTFDLFPQNSNQR